MTSPFDGLKDAVVENQFLSSFLPLAIHSPYCHGTPHLHFYLSPHLPKWHSPMRLRPSLPRWLTQLDSRWPQRGTSLRYALSRVLREYLLCEDADAAATYAKRFDDFYHTVFLERFNTSSKDVTQHWSGYLLAFYQVVYEAAEYMAYDDPLQDKVVALFGVLSGYPWKAQWIYLVGSLLLFLLFLLVQLLTPSLRTVLAIFEVALRRVVAGRPCYAMCAVEAASTGESADMEIPMIRKEVVQDADEVSVTLIPTVTKADLADNDNHEVPEDPDTNRTEEQRAQDAHAYENLYALAARLTASGLIFFFPTPSRGQALSSVPGCDRASRAAACSARTAAATTRSGTRRSLRRRSTSCSRVTFSTPSASARR